MAGNLCILNKIYMTQKEFLLDLDKLVKKWRHNANLFCGGCCFSAGQIAKILEKKGIRYQVICWQAGGLPIASLKSIVKNNHCNHVAIQVSLDGEKFIIGGDFHSLSTTNKRIYYFTKSNSIIDSDIIGAKLNTWNHVYDRRLNNKFIDELTILVSRI
jgi:hypothetical protein